MIIKQGHGSGFAFGMSSLINMGMNALVFYVSAVLLCYDNLQPLDMFTCMMCILTAATTIGNNAHFMGDVGEAKNAAVNLFHLLDAQDEEQMAAQAGCKYLKTPITGNIEFKNVSFKYPAREKKVLQSISLQIKQGQKVAFVGPSGCGKSTIMQLLLRFYNAEEGGQILIDG